MIRQTAALAAAFLEGGAVLIIEVAGARALAPYYGSSLLVWTSQITVTLLFLALGYLAGGRLSAGGRTRALPAAFFGAGAWLLLFPYWRLPVFSTLSGLQSPAAGSFFAASALYGPPLLALGAVTPLLIQALRPGAAGEAAGRVMFCSTLGGLAGAWLAALVLIPSLPLGAVLAGTGAVLGAAGALLAFRLTVKTAAAAALFALAALAAPQPQRAGEIMHGGRRIALVSSASTPNGLVQAFRDIPGETLHLTVNGVIQGGMDLRSGLNVYPFSAYQAYFGWRYHPRARTALLLGLGPGLLAGELRSLGLEVEAVEIEPEITRLARAHYGLPPEVKVTHADARVFLNRAGPAYDLIFLDVFSGESVPWHLLTRQSLEKAARRLNPGGRLVVNIITSSGGGAALARLEATLLSVFSEVLVFPETAGAGVVNACLVAGAGLGAQPGAYPGRVFGPLRAALTAAERARRPARAGAAAATDELSDFDFLYSAEAAELRRGVMRGLGPRMLAD